MNSWEEKFYDKLDLARESELYWIKRKYFVILGQVLTSWATSVLVINATFACYSLVGNSINAENAFIVISMFTVLQASISDLPDAVTALIETHIALNRISHFLNTDEIQDDYILKFPSNSNV